MGCASAQPIVFLLPTFPRAQPNADAAGRMCPQNSARTPPALTSNCRGTSQGETQMRHIAASIHAFVIAIPGVGMLAESARADGPPDIAWMSGGHGGLVESVALSPDGQLFASVSPGD